MNRLPHERIERIYLTCVEELRHFLQSIGKTDVVLGLSGGIDSSVTACMCVDACGADHVHGVLMPGPFSSDHSIVDAQVLARNLSVKTHQVSIQGMYEAFSQALGPHIPNFAGVTSENAQARCRMVVLMSFSNAYDWILINTDNKSEAMVGYSTLYGDTAGAFAPMGGIYKTDVYRIAQWLNDRSWALRSQDVIPHRVLTKAPSAELAPNQYDEHKFGSYEVLDRILIAYVEHNIPAEELVARGEDPETVQRVIRFIEASKFKRALLPPYPPIQY